MDSIVRDVLTARVYDVAIRTPLDDAPRLSAHCGARVRIKREDLQPGFSFKVRGAFNRISHLDEGERARGVICASAGNHAQGVAMAARHLGLKATVVMPLTTPAIKRDAVRSMGAHVVLFGETIAESLGRCRELAGESGAVLVHPYDDPLVIAGQGTVGKELLEQCPDADAIFVPIGGGGLISGISGFLKTLRPGLRVVGVQAEGSESMRASLAAGEPVTLADVAPFADGVAVKQVSALTLELVRRHVDELVTVGTDAICSAIKAIYEDTRSIVEPAGALGVAGLVEWTRMNGGGGRTLVAVNSGANMNFDRLQFVAERARTGERREGLFAVTMAERPGALREFCEAVIGEQGVTEFNYRLNHRDEARVFVGLHIAEAGDRERMLETLEARGYACADLTDNELAKTHVRHMVGGRSGVIADEVLYHFRFPERPGALMDFLLAMQGRWNISLFHYRMHGADFGRVLVGFEVPPEERTALEEFLETLSYPFREETENPAYRLFL